MPSAVERFREIVARSIEPGLHAEIHPDHALLRGERGELGERAGLVAGQRAGIGEACGDLVFPGIGEPGLGRGIHELFHWCRGGAHISRRAKDDGVGRSQLVPRAGVGGGEIFGLVERDLGAGGCGALAHMFGNLGRVAIAGVIYDSDLGHEDVLSW